MNIKEYIPLANKVNFGKWEDFISQIPNNSCDLLLSDVPFGMNYQSNGRKEKHLKIENDDDLEWLPTWLQEMKRVLKEDAHVYIFCSHHKIEVFKTEIQKVFNYKNTIVWDKLNGGQGDLEGDYAPRHELIIYCSNGKKKLKGKRYDNIIQCSKVATDDHPTEKPVELISLFVRKSSNAGDVVIDTFAGVFTTAQACVKEGRNWICFEMVEKYCITGQRNINSTTLDLFPDEYE